MDQMQGLSGTIIAFLLIGVTLGVGILVLNNIGSSVFYTNTQANESLIFPNVSYNTTLAHGNLTVFTKILNVSGATVDTGNYSVNLAEGYITGLGNNSACKNTQVCYAYYTYKEYDTPTRNSVVNTSNALADISTTWLSILITIVIIGILMSIVLQTFRGKQR